MNVLFFIWEFYFARALNLIGKSLWALVGNKIKTPAGK